MGKPRKKPGPKPNPLITVGLDFDYVDPATGKVLKLHELGLYGHKKTRPAGFRDPLVRCEVCGRKVKRTCGTQYTCSVTCSRARANAKKAEVRPREGIATEVDARPPYGKIFRSRAA